MNLNNVVICGHLGADAEIKFTKNETPICDLRLAVKRASRNGEEKTDWIPVRVMGKWTGALAGVKKGANVMVSGTIQSNEWTDREGKKKTSYSVFAYSVGVLARKEHAPRDQEIIPPANDMDDITPPDDIPF